MCGRFVLFTTGEQLLDQIKTLPGCEHVEAPDGTPSARYNIAPTQQVPLIRFGHGAAQVDSARWGLLPSWKKDDSGPPLFNARGETVAEKPSFRSAFSSRRGLMVLDGYYEWKDKVPHFVTPNEGMLFAAALWDTGCERLSTTMVTTESVGEKMTALHNRLPLFLLPEEVEQWVNGTAEQARELLHPSRLADDLSYHPVAREVGNVRNDDARLIEPVAPA